ncbi:hypothetical protein ACG93R_22135 [Acinetobacter guillouiae]|uniref:hypothetical protein n=1 Tax=Acinetobacter guillouiae TaxID=106649 RepID=UPI003AF544BA
MDKFKEWFVSQYFYSNLRFVHGDALFDKDGDFFRILAVQIAWEAWQSRQAELDQAYEDIETFVQAHQRECDIKVQIANELKEKDKRINQALNFINNWWHPDLDQKLFVEALGRALRGEHES